MRVEIPLLDGYLVREADDIVDCVDEMPWLSEGQTVVNGRVFKGRFEAWGLDGMCCAASR